MVMIEMMKPGKARGSLRVFSAPNESGSEKRSGSDTPKLQNFKYKYKDICTNICIEI